MNIGRPLRTVTYPLPEKVELPQPVKVEPEEEPVVAPEKTESPRPKTEPVRIEPQGPEEKPIFVPNWPTKAPVKVPEKV